MAYTQNDNSGSLFRNERKEKDTHPGMTGSAMIDGVEYWVNAWTKEGQKGRWQSLSFKRKEPKTSYDEPRQATADELNDEIPF